MAHALIFAPMALDAAGVAITASATAGGHEAGYVANDHAGVVWKSPTGTATRTLTVDLGADADIDVAMLFGLDGAQPGWTLTIEAATSAQGSGFGPGDYWSSGTMPLLGGSEMPVNGRGIALWQADEELNGVSAPTPARYWRFRIGGLASAAAVVARLAMGRRLRLERNFSYGAAFGVRDLGNVDFSRGGVMLRQRGARLRSIGISFASVFKDEVEAQVQPLIEAVGNTGTIALVTDPAADPMRQRRCWFGPMVGDVGTIWRSAAGWEWRVNLVSLF